MSRLLQLLQHSAAVVFELLLLGLLFPTFRELGRTSKTVTGCKSLLCRTTLDRAPTPGLT